MPQSVPAMPASTICEPNPSMIGFGMDDLFDLLLDGALMVGVPGYFVLQAFAFRFAGGWRSAALAPLIVSVPLLGWCLYALAAGSNIWPLPVIFFAPFGTIYLLIVMGLRYWRMRASPPARSPG
jgi:hypothetical protein